MSGAMSRGRFPPYPACVWKTNRLAAVTLIRDFVRCLFPLCLFVLPSDSF